MRQGKMKWYNGKKCFGFVAPDTPNESGNQDDVFVHSSALHAADLRFLNEGDVISFDDEPRGDGKLSAVNIKLISRDEEAAKKFQERRHEHRSQSREDGHRRGGDHDDKKGFFGKIFRK